MTPQPQIMIVGADPMLAEEFQAAMQALRAYQPVLRFVDDHRQAVEAARSWQPHVALVDMEGDFGPLKHFAREIYISAPETAVVGVFRPEVFATESRENSLLIEAFRAGVKDFIRRPVSSSDISDLLDRLLTPVRRFSGQAGKIVSFISNKGGVGKSTLAVNTACGLARQYPEQVLLIDSSLQLGTCASLLNVQPATTLTDVARQHERLDETLIRQLAVPHHSGLHLLAAPTNAMEGTEVTDEVLSRLLSLARRSYRYTVVDTFPIIDRTVVAALDVSDLVNIVLENVVPTLLGVSKLVDLLQKLGVREERQRIVLNRYQQFAGNPRRDEVARRLGRVVDHVIPYDRGVITAANFGEPFLLRAGRFSSTRRAFQEVVEEAQRLEVQRPSAQAPPSLPVNGHLGSAAASSLASLITEAAKP